MSRRKGARQRARDKVPSPIPGLAQEQFERVSDALAEAAANEEREKKAQECRGSSVGLKAGGASAMRKGRPTGSALTPAHKRLVKLLAEAAVEEYFLERDASKAVERDGGGAAGVSGQRDTKKEG